MTTKEKNILADIIKDLHSTYTEREDGMLYEFEFKSLIDEIRASLNILPCDIDILQKIYQTINKSDVEPIKSDSKYGAGLIDIINNLETIQPLISKPSLAMVKIIEKSFQSFDIDQIGYLDKKNFKLLLDDICDLYKVNHCKIWQVDYIFRFMDENGDNKLSLEEFMDDYLWVSDELLKNKPKVKRKIRRWDFFPDGVNLKTEEMEKFKDIGEHAKKLLTKESLIKSRSLYMQDPNLSGNEVDLAKAQANNLCQTAQNALQFLPIEHLVNYTDSRKVQAPNPNVKLPREKYSRINSNPNHFIQEISTPTVFDSDTHNKAELTIVGTNISNECEQGPNAVYSSISQTNLESLTDQNTEVQNQLDKPLFEKKESYYNYKESVMNESKKNVLYKKKNVGFKNQTNISNLYPSSKFSQHKLKTKQNKSMTNLIQKIVENLIEFNEPLPAVTLRTQSFENYKNKHSNCHSESNLDETEEKLDNDATGEYCEQAKFMKSLDDFFNQNFGTNECGEFAHFEAQLSEDLYSFLKWSQKAKHELTQLHKNIDKFVNSLSKYIHLKQTGEMPDNKKSYLSTISPTIMLKKIGKYKSNQDLVANKNLIACNDQEKYQSSNSNQKGYSQICHTTRENFSAKNNTDDTKLPRNPSKQTATNFRNRSQSNQRSTKHSEEIIKLISDRTANDKSKPKVGQSEGVENQEVLDLQKKSYFIGGFNGAHRSKGSISITMPPGRLKPISMSPEKLYFPLYD